MVSDDLLFNPPPLLLLLYMAQKLPGLKKLKVYKQGSLPYKKEISVQGGEILLEIYYWTLWMTLQCDLQFSLTIFLTIQALTSCFHFYWFLYIDKKMSREVEEKGTDSNQEILSPEENIKLDATPNSFKHSLSIKYKGG